jgi:hypothetical protein
LSWADRAEESAIIMANKRAEIVAIGDEADSSGTWSVRSE